MAVYNSSYRTTRMEIREKATERGIDSERGKFGNQSFVSNSIESFRYVLHDSERSTEMSKRGGPRVREKEKRITSRAFLTKPYWRSEISLVELSCFQIFLLRIDSKTLERTEVN